MFSKNNLSVLPDRLGKTRILLVWVALFVIILLIEGIAHWWTEPSTNITALISAIAVLHVVISSPWVVGFAYTFINGEQQKIAVTDGALRGAFAVLVLGATETIIYRIVFPNPFLVEGIWDAAFIFISMVQGAIAGMIATLWRNKDQEKVVKKEIENSDSQNVGPGRDDANDMLFHSAYIFILSGAAATLGILSYNYGRYAILSSLILLGPSIIALMITTLLWEVSNNGRSGTSVLIASLAFLISSIWIMLPMMPLLKQMWGLLYLFSILWVSVWHILTLIVVFALGFDDQTRTS